MSEETKEDVYARIAKEEEEGLAEMKKTQAEIAGRAVKVEKKTIKPVKKAKV